MSVFWPNKISNARLLSTYPRTGSDGLNHLTAKKTEKAGEYAKNGAHGACKNYTDMDSRGKKEKRAPKNN